MELRGAKVTLVGLGETTFALARLLEARGARPFVTESGPGKETLRAALESAGVPYEVGGHTPAAFNGAAIVVPSPGVAPDIAPIEAARTQGASVLGEMEIAVRFCRSKVLAVTGTNGKTTTTELLKEMVSACGRSVLLAGNNALPFSAAVMQEPAPEFIVLEVSSYQLETATTFHPWIGCVLNLTPDHLGRHKTMEGYAAVKARLFACQGAGSSAVVNEDDLWTAKMPVPAGARRLGFSQVRRPAAGLWCDGTRILDGDETVASAADVPLPGRHNLENALAALTMMRAGGFPWEQTLDALRGFRGVEHRIEHVLCLDGVDYYNDSKSTNVDSLKVALESFSQPLVLIAGGRGKGTGYESLRGLVGEHVKALVTLGEDAPRLEADLAGLVPTERAADMGDAVALAQRRASAGDAVLLSPACASFDMYTNFEERGRHFKACVQALANDFAGKEARR